MKHIIILGDGMADHPVSRLGNQTLLQYADTPHLDIIAKEGRCGSLVTIPDGFHPGSEVANTAILGYDLNKVYQGRGPLEAASIGYEMQSGDLALRCNIITLADGKIQNHHGGHLTTEQGDVLIKYLDQHLGDERIKFITGIQYRHLLVIKGGNKHLRFYPPHDNPGLTWHDRLVQPEPDAPNDTELSAEQTAQLINTLILKSQALLSAHPFNAGRATPANSIWPWGAGYRPEMETLLHRFPQIKSGVVISAVDLIRGIGHYAGLQIIKVPGVTGQYDTNYRGKVDAAIEALKDHDFVFLHIEASDEAGHDGDIDLKLRTIHDLDTLVVGPIYDAVKASGEDIAIAVLPDHPTPVEVRTHVNEPVPFAIWHHAIEPDNVQKYSEIDCAQGTFGRLKLGEFIDAFMHL